MGTTPTSLFEGQTVDAWIWPAARAAQEEGLPAPGGKEFVATAGPSGSDVVCPDEADLRELHRLYQGAVEYLTRRGARRIGLVLEGLGDGRAQQAVCGARAGAYRFTNYRPAEDAPREILVRIEAARRGALESFVALADAQDRARDWVNVAPNDKPPETMAKMFREGAPDAVQYRVINAGELQEMGAGGIVAVGSASTRPPAVLLGRYAGADPGAPWLALVGKGITFDSGGLSIKPAENMSRMKGDMAGAAAVMAALQAIARRGVRANILCVAAIAENIIGGAGFRPGDVLRMLDGTSVEIISTDAEGRLVLADALTIAQREGAAAAVDIATLTGANVVALGAIRAGMLSNQKPLAELVAGAAEQASEPVWELPHDPQYEKLLRSPVADLKNSAGRPAGVITGGLFVGHFAKNLPWVHLDIAGMAFDASVGRGNGFGVALLVAVAEAWAQARTQ